MADTRISELNELAGASVASGDLFVVVDVSDTTMAASGTDKKVAATSLAAVPALVAAFDAAGAATSAVTTHAGATDPHGDRAYAAALVDDLSGVTSAATARANLGLGTAATAASSDFATAAQGLSETLVIAIGDETTAITTGTAKVTFRMPWAFTLTAVRASLTTASSSGTPTFDINEGGVSILSTKLTIDANERTSTTAATAAVISDAALADDAEITIDVDVAGTNAAGAKITLIGTRS